jgi:hypothetical protein
VSEYWIINATQEPCGLPPRSALFLSAADGAWVPLSGELELSDDRVRDLPPVRSGRVHSKVLDGPFALAAFWAQVDELEAC